MSHTAPASDDQRELQRIVHALYAAVSSAPGVTPSIDEEAPFLHPLARKCRTVRRPHGTPEFQIMSGPEYAENVRALITERGFFEVEITHESFVYGNVAHVLSHYEGYSDEARTRRVKKGVNSIQFLKVDGAWKLFSMIWDDEENSVVPPGNGGRSPRV